ncbi:MAG: hypothetical protein M1831_005346 [Alyxoria varia]|nr:MAG: hypothetical protein M1831_005346 [Alyxoria varia]
MSYYHLRDTSTDSDASSVDGSSYHLILQHILSYPGTYEIPLRSMYQINSRPRAASTHPSRPASPRMAGNNSPLASPTTAHFPNNSTSDAKVETARLQSSLVNQISSLPSQPCSLPPVFITSFLRRCFPQELTMVDFPQALTALDYLKDLETRRRREIGAALGRLRLDREVIKSGVPEVEKKHSGVAAWVQEIEASERKVDALYTQLYIGLRRWILINELSLTPFDKHNCIAMLNTLYPPPPPPSTVQSTTPPAPQPTSKLTPSVLKTQRAGFFDWIRHVEHRGPSTLEPLMQQGKQIDDDTTGWPAVRECLDSYLRVANKVIEECQSVRDYSDFDSKGRRDIDREEEERRLSNRKADSGVSFSSTGEKRPSTSEKSHLHPLITNAAVRPRTSAGSSSNTSFHRPSPTTSSGGSPAVGGGSALEKIARELRKIRNLGGPPATPDQLLRDHHYPPPHERQHSAGSSNLSGGPGPATEDKENGPGAGDTRPSTSRGRGAAPQHQQHQQQQQQPPQAARGRKKSSDALTTPTPDPNEEEERQPRQGPAPKEKGHGSSFLRSLSRARSRSRARPKTSKDKDKDSASRPQTPRPSTPNPSQSHRKPSIPNMTATQNQETSDIPPVPLTPKSEFPDTEDEDDTQAQQAFERPGGRSRARTLGMRSRFRRSVSVGRNADPSGSSLTVNVVDTHNGNSDGNSSSNGNKAAVNANSGGPPLHAPPPPPVAGAAASASGGGERKNSLTNKALRKMRSLGELSPSSFSTSRTDPNNSANASALPGRKNSTPLTFSHNPSSAEDGEGGEGTANDPEQFDPKAMRVQREAWERRERERCGSNFDLTAGLRRGIGGWGGSGGSGGRGGGIGQAV